MVECQQSRIDFRLRTKYLDKQAKNLDDALDLVKLHCGREEAVSIGLLGNAAEIVPELVKRATHGGLRPDLVTDQTSAHDLINGYLPIGWTVDQWRAASKIHPSTPNCAPPPLDPARSTCARCSTSTPWACRRSTTATISVRSRSARASKTLLTSRASCPPTSVRSSAKAKARSAGSRCRANPEDIYKTDAKIKELFPQNLHVHRWLDMARSRIAFQGLPARICWLGLGERHLAGLAFNEMVRTGELKAPIVIGRDHLDTGSVASPNRETESMRDGSDAVSDWPLLNALLNTAGGATWVSFHHGGGVGMGYSQHAGVVIVCDGTEAAAKRIERVLFNDPASGVMRHADAGYPLAIQTARAHHLKLPLLPNRPLHQ